MSEHIGHQPHSFDWARIARVSGAILAVVGAVELVAVGSNIALDIKEHLPVTDELLPLAGSLGTVATGVIIAEPVAKHLDK